jgi:hypothetical protein
LYSQLSIPAPLEDAHFRKSERFIIKAHFFIKGYSLKKKGNAEYDLPSLPPRGWFRNALCYVIDFDKDAAWMQFIRECRSIFS